MLPSSLSRVLVRQVDQDAMQQLGMPGLLLMENAARGLCDAVLRRGPWNSITILAGPGNNGGDGLAAARLLAASGQNSTIMLLRAGRMLSADAASNLSFLRSSGLTVVEPSPDELRYHLRGMSSADLLVDALLGTGIRGTVHTPFAEYIGFINESPATVLSVDVPSGFDCDLGTPCGVSVKAGMTVTFVAKKQGFLVPSAREYTGDIEVCHIGIPQSWLMDWYRRVARIQEAPNSSR